MLRIQAELNGLERWKTLQRQSLKLSCALSTNVRDWRIKSSACDLSWMIYFVRSRRETVTRYFREFWYRLGSHLLQACRATIRCVRSFCVLEQTKLQQGKECLRDLLIHMFCFVTFATQTEIRKHFACFPADSHANRNVLQHSGTLILIIEIYSRFSVQLRLSKSLKGINYSDEEWPWVVGINGLMWEKDLQTRFDEVTKRSPLLVVASARLPHTFDDNLGAGQGKLLSFNKKLLLIDNAWNIHVIYFPEIPDTSKPRSENVQCQRQDYLEKCDSHLSHWLFRAKGIRAIDRQLIVQLLPTMERWPKIRRGVFVTFNWNEHWNAITKIFGDSRWLNPAGEMCFKITLKKGAL